MRRGGVSFIYFYFGAPDHRRNRKNSDILFTLVFYTSMKTLWARMRMFYVRSKRDMFVTDGKGEMTKLQPSSALRETNHTLRFDSKHNWYVYL
jgi:hypothetical protein